MTEYDRPLGPWLRVELLDLMQVSEAHAERNPYSPRGVGIPMLEMSGAMYDAGWNADDVTLALREMVAIGHATVDADGVRHYSTEAGRLWCQAEHAAEQSRVDALEAASVNTEPPQ